MAPENSSVGKAISLVHTNLLYPLAFIYFSRNILTFYKTIDTIQLIVIYINAWPRRFRNFPEFREASVRICFQWKSTTMSRSDNLVMRRQEQLQLSVLKFISIQYSNICELWSKFVPLIELFYVKYVYFPWCFYSLGLYSESLLFFKLLLFLNVL